LFVLLNIHLDIFIFFQKLFLMLHFEIFLVVFILVLKLQLFIHFKVSSLDHFALFENDCVLSVKLCNHFFLQNLSKIVLFFLVFTDPMEPIIHQESEHCFFCFLKFNKCFWPKKSCFFVLLTISHCLSLNLYHNFQIIAL
jgi:hypothetical protein